MELTDNQPLTKLTDIGTIDTPKIATAELGTEHSDRFRSLKRYTAIGMAGLKGAALGPINTLRDIAGEVRQATRDYKAISELVHEEDGHSTDTSSELEEPTTRLQKRVGFMALKAWYAAPFPAYQIADDTITYPLYLEAERQLNTGTAFGIAAASTLGLATAMGYGQRIAEKKKASLVKVETEEDTSVVWPALWDSTLNSSPWQVARKASEPRDAGEPIRLVGLKRIVAFAGAYAVVNTGLYTVAEKLPVNEWVGFGAMYVGLHAALGAVQAAKEQSLIQETSS